MDINRVVYKNTSFTLESHANQCFISLFLVTKSSLFRLTNQFYDHRKQERISTENDSFIQTLLDIDLTIDDILNMKNNHEWLNLDQSNILGKKKNVMPLKDRVSQENGKKHRYSNFF